MAEIDRKEWYGKRMIDLNGWHRQLHQVTGAMAVRFVKATPDDLRTWSVTLRGIADQMQARANAATANPPAPCDVSDQVSRTETHDPGSAHEDTRSPSRPQRQ
jgi:hypothetical protein